MEQELKDGKGNKRQPKIKYQRKREREKRDYLGGDGMYENKLGAENDKHTKESGKQIKMKAKGKKRELRP